MQIIFMTLEVGLVYSIMAFGIFITFKVLNVPDLTVDGTYTLGAAIGVVLIQNNNPFLGIFGAFVFGAFFGGITAILNTKLKINAILSGILVMTGLYSINLRIMKQPSISIFNRVNIYSYFEFIFGDYTKIIINLLFVLIMVAILYLFFKTQLGLALIATGDNENMVRASSINVDTMKIIGISIGNGLVAMSGALMVNYAGFADVSAGTGMMVVGIASIIVGEVIVGRYNLIICFIGVVVGAIVYRYILALAFDLGFKAGDLKLLSSLLIIIAVVLPNIGKYFKKRR